MVGIEHDHDLLTRFDQASHLRHGIGIGGRAIHKGDKGTQDMLVDGLTVVRAQLNLNPDNPALAHGLKQGRIKDQ